MSYREIPQGKILDFPSTGGFKGWESFFSDESVAHPAKANLHLLKWIIQKFTSEYDIILDPMAGTGSTIIMAALENRNGIAIEYEEKFCKMIRDNISLTKKQGTFMPKGSMACFQGDSRNLNKILNKSDVIITSPPYGNRLSDVAIHDDDGARMGYRQTIETILTSPPYGNLFSDWDINSGAGKEGIQPYYSDERHEKRKNIGNIPYYSKTHSSKRSPSPPEGKETYLEAMTSVYKQCYDVLASQGKMILITKNFIRDKQIVRLDLDTIRICKDMGFELIDRWYFKIPQKSFWKRIYHKKYPKVPEVEYEDILVFEKIQSSLRNTNNSTPTS